MERIKYLQRNEVPIQELNQDIRSLARNPAKSIFFNITELNAPDKSEELKSKKLERIIFEDVLTGLQASRIPVAFYILNEQGKISLNIGTMAGDEAMLKLRKDTLAALLQGSTSYIKSEPAKFEPSLKFQRAGIVLGMPCSKIESDITLPIDRLLQALGSYNWQCLVLAEPNDEDELNGQIDNMLTDWEQTEIAKKDNNDLPNPISDHYCELLKAGVKHFQLGKEIGSWATSVYLSGDAISYYQLAGLWKSIYAGEESKPQPIFITENPAINTLLQNLQSLSTDGKKGPSFFKHTYRYKTILNSRQLSAYIHLPKVETPGISLIKMNELDTMPQAPDPKTQNLALGTVLQRRKKTQLKYTIDLQKLSSHVFITGTTGGGKTTTIFNLLAEANRYGANFLVIESAKKEYRALKNHPSFRNLQVFTLGDENVAPFRLNPFEAMPGMSVSTHLGLLKSVFNASFGMWTPLPQVLEQCLYKIYEDRGWDLSYNTNSRVKTEEDRRFSFPTMTDLYNKIEDVTKNLGYKDETNNEIKASLTTRINSLRTGGKGKMLDTQHSFPMELLLKTSTVLEMENIGDDEDMAFVIGLLFIRLVEYRRMLSVKPAIPHLLVIEEAHRLLANVQAGNSEMSGNPKAKAVETFTNMLAEIRSKNQGIIISDQIPVKLAPEIIKNTNLKIVHRIVANDDRQVLAGSMGMEEKQSVNFVTLEPGKAVIFSQGDDTPLLVEMENLKDELGKIMPQDEEIGKAMMPVISKYDKDIAIELKHKHARIKAQRISENKDIRRRFTNLAYSLIEEDYSLEFFYNLLISKIRAFVREGEGSASISHYTFIQLSDWLATRMGDQQGWVYSSVNQLKNRLANLLLARLNGAADLPEKIGTYRELMFKLHGRSIEPFANCAKVCSGKDGITCLYRYAIRDAINEMNETGGMKEASENWEKILGGDFEEVANTAIGAAKFLIPKKEKKDATLKAGMCYAIQVTDDLTSEPIPQEFEKIFEKYKNILKDI